MVFRIHFTLEDLSRTSVSPSAHPLQELSIAMRVLRDRTPSVRFGAWRSEAGRRLPANARLAFSLTPSHGWVPAFMAPTVAGEPRELLDRVRATSRKELRADMEQLAARQTLPAWAASLGEDPARLRELADSLEAVHEVLVGPYSSRITSVLETDGALKTRQILHGGMEQVLAELNPPRVRWTPPVLHVRMASGIDADLHLQGRGLLLAPSVFGGTAPVIDPDAHPQPVLYYPAAFAEDDPLLAPPHIRAAPGALAQLLGRTRAAVLHTIVKGPGKSTSEVARAVGISVASASEHATTLRGARLISTVRHRNAVLHTPTATGMALLETT